MRLLTDANILVRCCLGRAMQRVVELRRNGVSLLTTEHHAHECYAVLSEKLGFDRIVAEERTAWVLRPFEVLPLEEYASLREKAERRLGKAAQADWPALAAALALGLDIWSDDRDFFGVGVPIWSTGNARRILALG